MFAMFDEMVLWRSVYASIALPRSGMLVVSKSFTVWCLTGQYAGRSSNASGVHNSRHAIAFFGLGTSLFQPHAWLQSPGTSSHTRFHAVTSCCLVKTSGTSPLTIGMPEWESPNRAMKCTMKGIILNSGGFREGRRGYYKPAGGDFSANGCRRRRLRHGPGGFFRGVALPDVRSIPGMAFVYFSVSCVESPSSERP